jgi:uncharacterized membrane protein YeaQ/YmgE (transglycosylase-associated protein family)
MVSAASLAQTERARPTGSSESPETWLVSHQREREIDVIGFLVAGLVIGALARVLMPGKQHLSIFMTLLLGLTGSVIGGVIANMLGTGSIWELNILGFVVAVVSAVALIGVFEGFSNKRQGDRERARI